MQEKVIMIPPTLKTNKRLLPFLIFPIELLTSLFMSFIFRFMSSSQVGFSLRMFTRRAIFCAVASVSFEALNCVPSCPADY